MAQSVLYPQGPLLIVDKTMRKKRTSHPWELEPLRVAGKDIKVSVLGTSAGTRRGKLRSQAGPMEAGGRTFRFVSTPAGGKRPPTKQRHAGRVNPRNFSETLPQGTSDVTSSSSDSTDSPSRSWEALSISNTIPRSYSPLYGRYSDYLPSAMDVLSYYGDMSYFYYPLQALLPLEFDPVTTIYLPEAMQDICMLNAVVTTTASRLHGKLGWRPESGYVYFQTAIEEMQKRIRQGDISDAVLMAATCFVLRDYCQGRVDLSLLHVNGMLHMLDARGGLESVYPGFRQKIYRSILGPAIDFLSIPRWPRPEHDRPSLYSTLKLDLPSTAPCLTLLLPAGLDPELFEIMLRLHQLSQSINHCIATRTAVDPFSLDQDILTLQHDLLCLHADRLLASLPLSRACILAALVFTRLLTRELPLALLNSEALPTAMTELMGTVAILPETATLRFWCFFLGTMAARETGRRLLLIGDLRGSCIALGVSSWEKARFELTKVAWVGQAFESEGRTLWEEIDLEGV